MKITWYGTASISIHNNNDSILFDPFTMMNENLPSPSIDQFALFDNIFITHSHFDHIIDVPRILNSGNATVYCSRDSANLLIKDGVDQRRIALIAPGAIIKKGSMEISVFRGRHIQFDLKIILKTLLNRRTLSNIQEVRKISRLAKLYPEGEVFLYKISTGEKTILHLGSLNLDPDESYPEKCDLLTIPYQGRSDLDTYSMQFIEKLKPKALYLHHYDDAFPPVSSAPKIIPFQKKVSSTYPRLPVIVPSYGETIVL